MCTLAAFLAALTFILFQALLGTDTTIGTIVPWLPAAVVSDQVNFWLLVGILYLANGASPRETWHAHRWAIPLNLTLTSVGGAVLAAAARQFGVSGILIFFLPIILSAYAFRLYVNKAREQMDRLEELVEQRTSELAQANGELRELHKQKDAFLAVLTHDMRSPLTSIHGFAAMLRDRPDLPADKRVRMADIILRSESTLLEIVNNILDIEKLESGSELLLERDHFDLNEVLDEVAEQSLPQAEEKQIAFHWEPAEQPLFIQADRQKIQRVMQNLVSNALKYTPEEGEVCAGVRRNGEYAIFDVVDNGYGIPAEDLPHIFDRFRRVASHKSRAVGTGLGLAIVKNLVEAHEGAIEVQSKVNAGSTFTVKLPL
jgi:signal transduction histidine kinase